MPRGSNMEDYTIAKINKEWKSYNTNRTNWPIEIEKYFFYSTQFYREKMYIPENILKSLLATSNTKNIFEEIFERLLKYHKEYLFTRDSIINVLELYFEFVKSNSMEFDLNYDGINFNFINKKEYGIKDCLLTNKPIFSQDMDLNIVSSYEKIIELIRNGEIRDRYGLIEFSLYTLIELFKNTKISPQINNHLILKKYDLINILEFENYIFKDYLKSFE